MNEMLQSLMSNSGLRQQLIGNAQNNLTPGNPVTNSGNLRQAIYQQNLANMGQQQAQQPVQQPVAQPTPQQTATPQFRGFNQPAQQQAQPQLGSGQGLYDYLSGRTNAMSGPEYKQNNLMLQAMGMPSLPERQVNPMVEFLYPIISRNPIPEHFGFSKYL